MPLRFEYIYARLRVSEPVWSKWVKGLVATIRALWSVHDIAHQIARAAMPPQIPQGVWTRTTRPRSLVLNLVPRHPNVRLQMSHRMSWSPLMAQMPRMARMVLCVLETELRQGVHLT